MDSAISGANTNLFNPTQTGNYTLTVSSGVGCDSTSSPISITVVPNITGTLVSILPSTDLICGATSITFNADTALVGQWSIL
jgi:Flp pilus assembly protein TadG